MLSSMARLGKVDVRKDEEQNKKLSELMKLLFNVGYYRAGIKGLSPFDKIIGGMSWCIEMCNFDIDVDLLFRDNFTIGEKIALTEKIVKVLKYMKCPYRLEPHQIQGLDAIHIFPVIDWLVQLTEETRVEYESERRTYALDMFERQFSKHLITPSRQEEQKKADIIHKLKVKFGPRLEYTGGNIQSNNLEERLLLTLCEYAQPGKEEEAMKNEIEDLEAEEKKLQEEVSEKLIRCKSETPIPKDISTVEKSLSKLIVEAKENISIAKEDLRNKENVLKTVRETEDRLRKELERNSVEYEKLKEEIQIADDAYLAEIIELVEANKNLKEKISKFKEDCKTESENLNGEISHLKESIEKPQETDAETLEMYEIEKNKYEKLERMNAEKSLELERLKMELDEVPGRAELAQYQKRFAELYNQVQAVHHETGQFYALYNTLIDSKFFMEWELNFLDEINDNLNNSLSSPLKKSQFNNQLKIARKNVGDKKEELNIALSSAEQRKDKIVEELNHLQQIKAEYGIFLQRLAAALKENEELNELIKTH